MRVLQKRKSSMTLGLGSAMKQRRWLCVCLALLLSVSSCIARRKPDHVFDQHDFIPVYTNTVGPRNNPMETYPYYVLPFCEEGKKKRAKQDLSEILVGDRKHLSPYELSFKDPFAWKQLCEIILSPEDLKEFKDAIEDDYFFEMLIDDLPLWGYVGEVEGEDFLIGKQFQQAKVYLYTHLEFTIGYHGSHIVSVDVTTDQAQRVDITDTSSELEVKFSYSVVWKDEPSLKYENRMSRYVDSSFLPNSFEIHWLSIINSFVLVLLLTAFLTIVLMRILRNDFSRYMDVDEDELTEEETGWKLIHGDVFRVPQHLNLFTAFVGAGAQISATAFTLLAFVLVGVFRPTKRGSILTYAIMLYSLMGIVGGFVSARLYKQLKGRSWVWNIVLTGLVFPIPLLLVFSWVNSVAWSRKSTSALPATTIALILSIFVFVAFPLTVVGGILGRNTTEEFQAPCRTNKVPREVPSEVPWYRSVAVQALMAGFLPFSAIYIELHYIFASIWGHKIYSLFGILFLAFVMLFMVTSFITIALLYFQLAREDHRWWWRSLLNGGATGLFIYGYSFHYFFQRSLMDGLLQGSFFFGYMAVISYAFFLMLGFVGFYSSFVFVRHIYSVVKTD